jgi:hypothetical protein
MTITECNSFMFYQNKLTSSGIYTKNFLTKSGCDSTIELNLTILKPTSSTLTFTVCDSLIYNDKVFKKSGVYTEILTNKNGCDSTVTLNVTVLKSTNATILKNTACGSFSYENSSYTKSGFYLIKHINQLGCDSTVFLDLTILKKSESTVNKTVCGAYVFEGKSFDVSGEYVFYHTNSVGCDSVITLNLIINPTSFSSKSISACESYNIGNQTYTNSGVYYEYLTNSKGCDSIIQINLSLTKMGNNIVYKSQDTLWTLQQDVTYKWIDCNSNKELTASNQWFTPDKVGNYKVQVKKDGCENYSNCILVESLSGINEIENTNFYIYPNPTNDKIQINSLQNSVYDIKLIDLIGQIVYQQENINNNVQIDLSILPSGTYIIQFTLNEKSIFQKITKN